MPEQANGPKLYSHNLRHHALMHTNYRTTYLGKKKMQEKKLLSSSFEKDLKTQYAQLIHLLCYCENGTIT